MQKREAENLALLLYDIIHIPDERGIDAETVANNAIDAVKYIREQYPMIDEHLKDLEEIYDQ